MSKKIPIILYLAGALLVALGFFNILYGGTGAFEDDIEFEYAKYLYKKGFYDEASLELNRYIFFTEDMDKKLLAKILLSVCYVQKGDYSSALGILYPLREQLAGERKELSSVNRLCEVYYQIFYILFLKKNLEDYVILREQLNSLGFSCPEELGLYIGRMELALYIYNLQWDKALEVLDEGALVDDPIRARIKEKLFEARLLHKKSPVLGGILNLIPGLGYLYAGRSVEAGRSFLINGSFLVLAAYSLSQEKIGFGIAFSTIGTITYIANIYGGVNAIRQRNAIDELQRSKKILEMIPIPAPGLIAVKNEIFGN